MSELLTAAQMRALEAAAIASGQVTGLELMERAGRGVVQAIFDEWPALRAGSFRAVVLCGPGNNGGDGFVVARLLKERGWEVSVALAGRRTELPTDANANCLRWEAFGQVAEFPEGGDADEAGWIEAAMFAPEGGGRDLHQQEHVVIVDALFGTGLKRAISDAGFFLQEISLYRPDVEFGIQFHVVAVDIPSGLCADSGRVIVSEQRGTWRGTVCPADLTVTFQEPKLGHILAEAADLCGKLRVIDIGLSAFTRPPGQSFAEVVTEAGEKVQRNVEWLQKKIGHKYSHGHALILGGPPGHGGAARLSARGALRIGAGLVTLGCPPEALPENAARLDAIMLREVVGAQGLAEVLQDKRINALCIGPGLGVNLRAAGLVAAALGAPPSPSPPHEGEGGRAGQGAAPKGQALPLPPVGKGQGWGARSVVLDADALTLIARDARLFAMLHPGCILTPHGGEFARLFPDIAAKLDAPATRGPAYSKVDATREAAARAGCVVLFKGADTVIAAPDGRCAINAAVYDRAAPWLATAGSGDVLAGFITGLVARGFSPFDAACTGAWAHVECARSFGPGLIAEDLPEQVPKVFRALGL